MNYTPYSINYNIKLIGYCSLEKNSLLEEFIQKGPSTLLNLEGEYIIVIENNNECYIITSTYGVCQYYYVIYKNKLFHDDTVIGVLKKSQLPWSWNWKALSDFIQLDHVLENDTLHPSIYRVPARSILYFKDGKLKITSLSWEKFNPTLSVNPYMALSAFNNATKMCINKNIALSFSGGFDSRLILSSLLRSGHRPLIFTMGFDNSTDVVLSRMITTSLGLNSMIITLNLEDYLKHGATIVSLTNGTQIAQNWHAYLFIQKIKSESENLFFFGINGEFARSYYFDKGIIAQTANMLAPLSLMYFWKRSLKSIFKKEEINSLCKEFSDELKEDSQRTRLNRIIHLCNNKFLSGLDRFYLEQRLRNFFGNILRLYSENVSWRAPFLNREWINIIWNLKRNWKLGSNWHRFAISKNYPLLLDFPEPGKSDRMYPKAPLLYWHPIKKKYPIIHYTKYTEWFQSNIILDFIQENASLLSELIEVDTIFSILREHKKRSNRTRAIDFLFTMIFWLKNLKEVYKD